ncbi:MAG: ABC-F family ATP-binding cassette domain-containing protein, partial [Clostridia bacterium]|nr:ABC-F family ATP-binding cassette domain-containing protein [Clostridia bacterium]
MDIITFSHVNKSFGEQQVLEDVSFTVRDNDKIGIMGINGAGKTTLFRILMGEMDHDDGYVSVRKNLNLGYMAQQIELDSQASAYEEGISVFSDLLEMEDRIQELQYRMDGGDHSIETVEAFSKVQERYIDNGGMTYKSITLSVMRNLGLSET